MSEPLFTYRGVVYPWHCDQMGHMNVMWYTGKCDEATWAFFAELGLDQTYFSEHNRGMAALEIKFTYKAEVLAGEVVQIHTRLNEISGKIIKFTHEMTVGKEGKVAALADVVGVHMDTEHRKSCTFPQEAIDKAHELLEVINV
ncbi:MAG: acyl-CoA thioesterase [Rhodospirillales bacterium]|nr:acyl-CoA thioesterase [Rhodospirillales bacterium]